MKRQPRGLLLLATSLAILVGGVQPASAYLTHMCVNTAVATDSYPVVPGVQWLTPGVTVNVYRYQCSGSACAHGQSAGTPAVSIGSDANLDYAIGLSADDTDTAVTKAVGVWNEQTGAKMRLRYMGATSSYPTALTCSSGSTCSVVIFGNVVCLADGSTAYSWPTLNSSGVFIRGGITMHKFSGGNPTCTQTSWTTDATDYYDVTRTLVHELGHTVFAMGHPSNYGSGDCTIYDPSGNQLISVMNASSSEGRTLRGWDKEIAQDRYGLRSATALQKKSMFTQSTGVWSAAATVAGTSGHPMLFGMSSMTQQQATRVYGWSEGSSTPSEAGAGLATAAEYNHATAHIFAPDYTHMPIAIASEPYTVSVPTSLMAYERKRAAYDYYDSERYDICFYQTDDFFVGNYGTVCLDDSSVNTTTYGFGAAYTDTAASYVFAFTDVSHNVSIAVWPTGGGSLRVQSLGPKSPRGPAIACQTGTTSCLVAYEANDAAGGLAWIPVTITSTAITPGTTGEMTTDGGGRVNVDSLPGLAWDLDDNTYRLSLGQGGNQIRSYKKTATASSWTSTGYIFTDFSGLKQVSSAALSSRHKTGATTLSAWFQVYF